MIRGIKICVVKWLEKSLHEIGLKSFFSFSEHACCQSAFLKVGMAKNNSIIISFAESMKFIRYEGSL